MILPKILGTVYYIVLRGEWLGWTTMGCVWWELLRVYMFILPLNILIYACVYHAFKKKEKKIWFGGEVFVGFGFRIKKLQKPERHSVNSGIYTAMHECIWVSSFRRQSKRRRQRPYIPSTDLYRYYYSTKFSWSRERERKLEASTCVKVGLMLEFSWFCWGIAGW